MARYTLKLNKSSIELKIRKAFESPKVRKAAYDRAYSFFRRAKTAMLKQFNEHKITQEIEWGPDALNISGTLDGYGNLFSFLGFYAGSEPVADLRYLLESQTGFSKAYFNKDKYYFRVTVPSIKEVEQVTPMVWELGNSWATAVETGVSGFSFYMFKEWKNGRSGTGIQLPYENMEDASFEPKPYISEILENFRDRITEDKDYYSIVVV